jgi:hypothetical protein
MNQRVPIRGRAVLKTKRGVLSAQTVDISAFGVCLTLPYALDVGSSCQFELEIQADPTRRTSAVGQVCFCLHEKDGYRVGLNCALGEFIG